MPANFYTTTMSPSTNDLLHKLGFSNQPAYDRKQEIKTQMSRLQQWLDDDAKYETSTTQPLPPPPVTFIARPAILIASTGSIRQKRRKMAAKAAKSRASSSSSSTHSGSTNSDSSSSNTNVNTLESFPMFIPSSPEEVEMDAGAEEHNEGVKVAKQAGLLGTFGRVWRTICRN